MNLCNDEYVCRICEFFSKEERQKKGIQEILVIALDLIFSSRPLVSSSQFRIELNHPVGFQCKG